ncbi:MAG: hypothetical protein VKI81_00970 [Synechococcaceae cyanobacterium]|nr:hypothetical protein [Synechococcaceae cyanobacterium]
MPPSPATVRSCLPAWLLGGAAAALLAPLPASAGEFGEIVRTFCLSAFRSEMADAGKIPPAGMADYACNCVTDRLRQGSSLAAARSDCRLATASRFRI